MMPSALLRWRKRSSSRRRAIPDRFWLAPEWRPTSTGEAVEGRAAVAIERLRRLVLSSDDPYYACQLARVSDVSAEATFWRVHATARYEELAKRHPGAYADHAERVLANHVRR